jgi:hypothetical protein
MPRLEEKDRKRSRKDRHDIMLFHGIRKYVNHALVNAGCNVIARDLLIGHAAPGLEGSYLRPTEEELLAEFVKAIPTLSLTHNHIYNEHNSKHALTINQPDNQLLKCYNIWGSK